MFKHFIYLTGMSLIFISCNTSNTTEQKTNIDKKDTVVAVNSECEKFYAKAKASDEILMRAQVLDKDVASKAINDFNTFASSCKNDSLAPVFYLKAGQVAHAIGNFSQSLAMLNKCINQYPQFKNRGAALFLMAQLYDDQKMLNNEEEAKKLYEQILKEYPKSPWANDSKAAIKNLGKTDEQLIQEFLKKNK